jgi:hypothetical protein
MKAPCGIDTKDCNKTRQECDQWAKCTLAETAERNAKGVLRTALEHVSEQKKRIITLEHALCEAEARSLLNYQRYEELRNAMDDDEEGTYLSWDDLPEGEKDIRIDFARRGLKAEGKI